MNDSHFQLTPSDPDTDSMLILSTENKPSQSSMVKVIEWRRILPNKNYVVINNPSFSYQCTSLDKNCTIQVKLSFQMYGNTFNRSISSKPIKLSPFLRMNQIQPLRCQVRVDEYSTEMKVVVEKNKLKFIAETGTFQLTVYENTVESYTDSNCLSINLCTAKDQFLSFFNASLRRAPKYHSETTFCVFNKKMDRDTVLSMIADNYQITGSKNHTPRTNHYLNLAKDNSDSSLTSINKNIDKDNKIKVSEQISLKKSNDKPFTSLSAKTTSNTSDQQQKGGSNKLLMSGQCLNIFEDDDEQFLNYGNTNKKEDKQSSTQMDLRESFEQLQMGNNGHGQYNSGGEFSSFSKNNANLEEENRRLKEENMMLKKQLEGMQDPSKIIANLKKKYMSSIEDINRLENERREIITDKVKFESKYHKESQEKQILLRQLESHKAKLNIQ